VGNVTLLEDSTIDGLARYYAAQPRPRISGDAKLIGEGRRLFEEGVPSRDIAACASCHGKDAGAPQSFHGSPGSTRLIWCGNCGDSD
jgi:cytochrome c553